MTTYKTAEIFRLPKEVVSTLQLKACMPCSRGDSAVLGPKEPPFEMGVEMEGHVDFEVGPPAILIDHFKTG